MTSTPKTAETRQDGNRWAMPTVVLASGILLKVVATEMTLSRNPRGYTIGAHAADYAVSMCIYGAVLAAIALIASSALPVVWPTLKKRGLVFLVFAFLFLAAGIVDICAAVYTRDTDEKVRSFYAGATPDQPTLPPAVSVGPAYRNSQSKGDLAYQRYVEEVAADLGSTECGTLVRQILEQYKITVRAKTVYEREALIDEPAQALAMLGPSAKAAVPVLIGMLDFKRNCARCCEGLDRGSWEDWGNMAKCSIAQEGAIKALGRIGPLAAPGVPRLIAILHEKCNVCVKIRTAWALGQIGPAAKDAVPSLVDIAAHDEDPFLRDTAASALEAIRLPASSVAASGSVRPIVRCNYVLYELTQKLTCSGFEQRYEAIRAIGALGPSARLAVPNLIAVTEDDNPSLRAIAASALGQVGPGAKAAIPALTDLASKDPNSAVREAAASALSKIKPRN